MILNCEKAITGQKFQIEDFTIYYTDGCSYVILKTTRDINDPTYIYTLAWAVSSELNIKQVIKKYEDTLNNVIQTNSLQFGWVLLDSHSGVNEPGCYHNIQNELLGKQKINSIRDLENILIVQNRLAIGV